MEIDNATLLQGALDWVNSYLRSTPYHNSLDLCDGVGFARVLVELAPDHFTMDGIRVDGGLNWVLAQNNLRSVIRNAESYYHDVLEKDMDFDSINVSSIAQKRHDAIEELLKLCELLVGMAVQCEERASHIGIIMNLPLESQTSLQVLIESVMGKLTPYEIQSSNESVKMSNEMRQLEDRVFEAEEAASKAMDQLQAGLLVKEQLQEENQILHEKLSKALSENFSRSANSNETEELQRTVDELQSVLEEKDNELSEVKISLLHATSQIEKDAATRIHLEQELQHLSDDLDLAQSIGAKLLRAEAAIERYKQKIEEMLPLKDHADELERQNSHYLEQIIHLEGELKGMALLKKKLEQYKDEKIEKERISFQAESALALKQDEVARLKSSLHEALEAKRYFENELIGARDENQALSGTHERSLAKNRLSSGGSGVFESAASLSEKVIRLQKENDRLKAAKDGDSSTNTIDEDTLEKIELLQSQLEDALRAKQDRANDALAAKRQAAELEAQVHQLQERIASSEGTENVSQKARNDSNVRKMNDAIARLEAENEHLRGAEMTVKHMVDQCKASESKINELEEKNDKLERYIKDKVVKTISKYKKNNEEAKEENERLTEKNKTDAAMAKRERQLMTSFVFNLGLEIASKNLRNIVEKEDRTTGTWLQQQRNVVQQKMETD